MLLWRATLKWYPTAIITLTAFLLYRWLNTKEKVGEKKTTFEHENIFAFIVQRFNDSISTRSPDQIALVEQQGKQLIEYCERVWGVESLNMGLILGTSIAQIYELKQDRKNLEITLTRSVEILKKINKGVSIMIEEGIADKLVNYYTLNKDYEKAVKYAEIILAYRKAELIKNDNTTNTKKYANAIGIAAVVHGNFGNFKKSEAHFATAMEILNSDASSLSACTCAENYASVVYQQGRTTEALNIIERQIEQIIKQSVKANDMLCKLSLKAFNICISDDKWHEALYFISFVIKITGESVFSVNIQFLCDLATVYWEIGKVETAIAIEEKLKSLVSPYPNTQPLTRSTYLTTISCQISNGVYKLLYLVNRKPYYRKECEILQQNNRPRKIDKFYFEVKFENTNKSGEFISERYFMDNQIQLEITSPKMNQKEEDGIWYKVILILFLDNTKKKKIGSHHQLIYVPICKFK